MSILRNRHVLVAALVAPLLALTAYFAMDYIFGETPQAAREGQSYPLVEKPGCRWASGYCGLKINEFELDLSFRRLGADRLALDLESVFPLDGVMLAVVTHGADEAAPRPMQPAGDDGLKWTIEASVPNPGNDRLRLAASAGGAVYYGDASTEFTKAGRED